MNVAEKKLIKIKLAAISPETKRPICQNGFFTTLILVLMKLKFISITRLITHQQVLENITDNYPVKVINADKLFKKSSSNFQSLAYTEITKNALADGFTHLMLLDIDEFWNPALILKHLLKRLYGYLIILK